MSKEVLLQDQYAELVESLDRESATYGFVREEYEEGLEKIIDSLEMDYTWIGSGTEGEDVFYMALASEFDVLEDVGKDSTYRVKASKEEFEVLQERLDQHFERGYDKAQLIGILRAEHPNVSQRDLRDAEHLPSEQPFVSRFGSLNNARWRAGLPSDEQLKQEELEHQLVRKTHELNEDRDLIVETPSARDINEDEEMHNEKAFQEAFGSIEESFESAGLSTVRKLEKEMEDWREIIYTPHSDTVAINEKDAGHRL